MASDGRQASNSLSSDESAAKSSAGAEVSQKPEEVLIAVSSDESAIKPPEASLAPPVNVSGERNAAISAQQLSDASVERSNATPISTALAGSVMEMPASNNQQAANGSSSSSSKVTENFTETEQLISQATGTEEPTVDSYSGTSKDREFTGQTSDVLAAFVVPQNGVFEEYNAFKAAQIARREADGSASGKALGPPIMSPDGGVAVAPEMPAARPVSDYTAFKTLIANQEDQPSQGTNVDSVKQVTEDSPATPAQSTGTATKIDSGEGNEISGATVASAENAGQTSIKDEATLTPTPAPVLLAARADPNTLSTTSAKSNSSASAPDIPSTAAPNAKDSDGSPFAVPMKQADNETTSTTTATPATIDQPKLSRGESEPSVSPHSTTAQDSAHQTIQQLQSAESTMNNPSLAIQQLEVDVALAQSSDSDMAATDENSIPLLAQSATLPDDSSTIELHSTMQQEQPQAADAAKNGFIISAQDSRERTPAASNSTSTVADKLAMSRESAASIGAPATPVNESGVMNSSQDIHNEQPLPTGTMLKSLEEEDTTVSEPFHTAQVEIASQEVGASGEDSSSAVVHDDYKSTLSAQNEQSPAIETSSTISTEAKGTTAPMPPAQEISTFGLRSTNISQSNIPYPEGTVSVALDQSQPTATDSIIASMPPVQESSNIGSATGTTDQSSLLSTTIPSTLTGTEFTPAPLPRAQDMSAFGSLTPFPHQSSISSTIQPVQNLETAPAAAPVAAAQGPSNSVPSVGTLDQSSTFTGTPLNHNTITESTLPQMPPAQDASSFGQRAAITDSSRIPLINQPSKTLEIATTAAPMPLAQNISSFGLATASMTPTSVLATSGAFQFSTGESTVPAMPPAQDHSTFGIVAQSTAVTPPSISSINTAMQSAQSLHSFVVVDQMPGMSSLESVPPAAVLKATPADYLGSIDLAEPTFTASVTQGFAVISSEELELSFEDVAAVGTQLPFMKPERCEMCELKKSE